MKEQDKRNNIYSLAPLLLFMVFTTCIVTVLLIGADGYRTFQSRDQAAFERRITVQYLTTRIRQNDVTDGVSVGEFAGKDTLFLCEALDGKMYHTRIYCHDGYLRELFCEADMEFAPDAGEKIMELKDLQFHLTGNLLTVIITYPDDSSETVLLQLRSKREGLYDK